MAGIACGLLPPDAPPDAPALRAYFRRHLTRRRFGQFNAIGSQLGVFCLGRGGAGPIIETALRQVARVAGCSSRLWVQPAVRAAAAVAGDGQSPLPPAPGPDRLLAASGLVARLFAHAGLHRLADAVMAGATRRRWGALGARGSQVPRPAAGRTEHREGGPGSGGGKECVLYHCFGATHSSTVGAAIHCGILDRNRPFTVSRVLEVAGFDRRASSDIGHAFYAGSDEQGRGAFSIGFDGVRGVLTRASTDLLDVTGSRHVLLADTLSSVNPLVRLGGYLSRRLNLVSVGRPLAARGIVASSAALQAVVAEARSTSRKHAHGACTHPLAQVGCDGEANGR